jgi:hypothetical protein
MDVAAVRSMSLGIADASAKLVSEGVVLAAPVLTTAPAPDADRTPEPSFSSASYNPQRRFAHNDFLCRSSPNACCSSLVISWKRHCPGASGNP